MLSRVFFGNLYFTVLLGAVIFAGEEPDAPVPMKDPNGSTSARFLKQHEAFVARAKQGGVDLLLVGDFLISDFNGNNKNGVGAIYKKAFGAYNPAIFAYGGESVQHAHWRLMNGELNGIAPKVIMLMTGLKNGDHNDPPEKIYAGIEALIKSVRTKLPQTNFLVLSVLPFNGRAKCVAVNKLLPKLDDGGKSVLYVDLYSKIVQADGGAPKELMPDGAHLSDKGFQVWADAVELPLRELMGAK
jgi:hypothetical protein